MTVSFIIGDALQELARLDAGTADALITDPPYCSGALSEAGKARASHQGFRSDGVRTGRFSWFEGDQMTTAGLCWLLREVAVEALRLLKPTGHLLVFADWRMVPMLAPALESAGLRFRNLVVWDKGHYGAGTGFRPQGEMILHLTRSTPAFHAADVGNVIRCKRVHTSERDHPTEKPVELLQKLIRVTTPAGGLVVDPFAGSGSTGLAAASLGRSAVLIERSEAWIGRARARLDASAPLPGSKPCRARSTLDQSGALL